MRHLIQKGDRFDCREYGFWFEISYSRKPGYYDLILSNGHILRPVFSIPNSLTVEEVSNIIQDLIRTGKEQLDQSDVMVWKKTNNNSFTISDEYGRRIEVFQLPLSTNQQVWCVSAPDFGFENKEFSEFNDAIEFADNLVGD